MAQRASERAASHGITGGSGSGGSLRLFEDERELEHGGEGQVSRQVRRRSAYEDPGCRRDLLAALVFGVIAGGLAGLLVVLMCGAVVVTRGGRVIVSMAGVLRRRAWRHGAFLAARERVHHRCGSLQGNDQQQRDQDISTDTAHGAKCKEPPRARQVDRLTRAS
jgi:hypothetical protein